MIDHLTMEIETKDVEIQELKTHLESLNIKIDKLEENVVALEEENVVKEAMIDEQKGIIEDKIEEINTAYYTLGTKKSSEGE